MSKLLLAAAALAAVTAAPAFAKSATTHTFTRDGETYTYTTIDKGDRVAISGTNASGGTFDLVVRGDRISGVAGGVPVSFTMAGAQAKLTATELASR